MDKRVLRGDILGRRSQIPNDDISAHSDMISDRLYDMPEYRDSTFIFSFISFKDEVHTHDIIKNSIAMGKKVGVPITIPKSRIMKISQLRDFDRELHLGFYDILTPKDEYRRIVAPESVDLILVPGVAFDRRGYRIGYGGGYYDTFLAKVDEDVIKIGLCFHMQVIPKVPTESHDIPVDYILTERELIGCK
ncbi:MAG: 5-formyltetrahydrofolate cyclo-ligase [Tissierellia bacterium]|nr:5-formyltetrahydrofolate cyclo-ligase [Tissierellia bacterium]